MTDNFEFKGKAEVIHGITFEDVPSEAQILAARRAELGLSQQEVADKARILLRQYQRFESGERDLSSSSFRIAMAVCDALELDPHRFCAPV